MVLVAMVGCSAGYPRADDDDDDDDPIDARIDAGSDGPVDASPDAPGDRRPVAFAGIDRATLIGTDVTLDGSGSFDPDGSPVSFAWMLVNRPAGSTAALTGAGTAMPHLTPDRAGVYEVSLVVNDGLLLSVPDQVRITASVPPNTTPIARAGADVAIEAGLPVTLDGSASSDADGDPLTFTWTVTTQPSGSTAAPATPALATTTFTPALFGTYVLTLTVSDGAATATDTVTVLTHAGDDVVTLAHDVVDAEYAGALDAIVTISGDDQALYVLDPATGVEMSVALPLGPTAVSVAPDGLQAVVGHDGWISIVDLVTKTVVATHPVTTDAVDVIHGGNGWAYVMPRQDQWEQVRCVQLATGTEALGSGLIYAGAVGRRNPARPAIYTADRGLSPADIELHDIALGAAQYLRDSPYHGDYAMCGDLWFSDDGNRIFTACGNVFRSSTNPMTDMTYNGNLAGSGLIGFVDHSDQADLVAVMPRNGWMDMTADTHLRFYTEQFLALDSVVDLPPVPIGSTLVPNHGRFVFWRSDGTEFYVIMRATPAAGVPRDTLWTGTP